MTEKAFTPGAAICPTCRKAYHRDHVWKRVCVTCYLASKGKAAPTAQTAPAVTPIEPGMLRRLIQLCHPDKHGNSEASNAATCYLLALKGAVHG